MRLIFINPSRKIWRILRLFGLPQMPLHPVSGEKRFLSQMPEMQKGEDRREKNKEAQNILRLRPVSRMQLRLMGQTDGGIVPRMQIAPGKNQKGPSKMLQ